jgi:23S rRNA (uridine2552-2'-O)-methyltransferase
MSDYNRKDGYYRKAKAEGYRSRAAYKLIELDSKHRLLRKGMRLVDLGCAPGGWLQVASKKVGPKGRVVGIDRLEMAELKLLNTIVLIGDITAEDSRSRLLEALGGPADLVLSDMAPDTSGVAFADHVRSVELVAMGGQIARELLRPGGTYLAKVFEGPDLNELVADLKRHFGKIKRVKPGASRKGSKELYLVCPDMRA